MTDSRLFYFRPEAVPADERVLDADVCVYGATAGGVAAAVQAARMGHSAVLLEPGDHLGGMSAGGLGWTDFGNQAAVGGLARRFYRDVGLHYGEEETWRFEPHVAERVFRDWVETHDITALFRRYVDAVEMEGRRIRTIRCLGGLVVRARAWLDCSYEGDLMARAGVSFTVGRESNDAYGETYNGAQVRDKHQFEYPVDPYREPGTPGSGLLPGIDPAPIEPNGTGDSRVQAYNFRMCLTQVPENRLPLPKPPGYDPLRFELLLRYLAGGWDDVFRKFDPIPNGKTDANNHGAVSTDCIGGSYAWPEADYGRREAIFQDHVRWQQGLLWTLANHPRVPAAIRDEMQTWGLAADEFTDCGGWPHQLYVRECRRMVADTVMTEHHVLGRERAAMTGVGLGAYGMDSHNCRRFVDSGGSVRNEGDVQVHGFPPYPVDYGAIVPRRGECEDLAVPVCAGATHIAFGSIRMEPVFMVLGQSAATAASLALEAGCPIQDVPPEALRERLLADGQVLDPPGGCCERV